MTDKRVLCIAAHPDDEILMAGGTLAKHAASGHEVGIYIIAEGAASRGGDETEIAALRAAATAAASKLGVSNVMFGGLADQRLDGIDLLDIVQSLEGLINEFEPTTIYTQHDGDLNLDHQIVSRAVLTATRPLPGRTIMEIYFGETLSSTEWNVPSAHYAFIPDRYVDITDHLDAKRAALRHYAVEMRDFPHPRSIEVLDALAKVRGAHVGVRAAEAFRTVRNIWS